VLLDDPTQATIGWASKGGTRTLHAVLDALRLYLGTGDDVLATGDVMRDTWSLNGLVPSCTP
jgi:hypothetical protein